MDAPVVPLFRTPLSALAPLTPAWPVRRTESYRSFSRFTLIDILALVRYRGVCGPWRIPHGIPAYHILYAVTCVACILYAVSGPMHLLGVFPRPDMHSWVRCTCLHTTPGLIPAFFPFGIIASRVCLHTRQSLVCTHDSSLRS